MSLFIINLKYGIILAQELIMQIKLESLNRTYGDVKAVQNVSLTIPSNTVFGIIGKSGAGKSSLVRLVSLLEKPDSGEVFYDDKRVDNLSKKDLILQRRRIGMIFQNFNLFSSRTAAKNVAYPLEIIKDYINKTYPNGEVVLVF